jgi:two-component system NtrC family sensor kinase
MRGIPRRLALRLILALTLVVAIFEAVFFWLNLTTQERRVLEAMQTGADQLSRSITAATWHAMLADRRDDAYQVMETIGDKQGIESIRIFNKEGDVTFSTDPDAPTRVDKQAEACFLCHAASEPLVRVDVPNRSRVFEGRDGARKLGMIAPIYNEPACSTAECHAHPASQNVLGVVDIVLDLEPMDREVAAIELRTAGITLLEMVLLAVVIILLSRRLVGRPIRHLTRAVQAMSQLELDRRATVEADGEIGELAAAFNDMGERLERALSDCREFSRGLENKVEERSRQLMSAQRRLIQTDRMASLGQLAASVAHEINNPVSGVLNLCMLMQRIMVQKGGGTIPPGREEEFRRYLEQAIQETGRVGRIVSDLLSFSRRSSPRRTRADLNRVISDTVSLVSHKIELMGVAVELALTPDLPLMLCDASQIQQVVINLVMNAAEASPHGSRVTVRTATEADPARGVTLSVEDRGGGIPEDIQPRIFDPFFTTKEEGRGVGLGLAVVYGIIEAHGGTIEVHSVAGQGTTFLVRLPLQPAAGAEEAAPQPASSRAPAPPAGQEPHA